MPPKKRAVLTSLVTYSKEEAEAKKKEQEKPDELSALIEKAKAHNAKYRVKIPKPGDKDALRKLQRRMSNVSKRIDALCKELNPGGGPVLGKDSYQEKKASLIEKIEAAHKDGGDVDALLTKGTIYEKKARKSRPKKERVKLRRPPQEYKTFGKAKHHPEGYHGPLGNVDGVQWEVYKAKDNSMRWRLYKKRK